MNSTMSFLIFAFSVNSLEMELTELHVDDGGAVAQVAIGDACPCETACFCGGYVGDLGVYAGETERLEDPVSFDSLPDTFSELGLFTTKSERDPHLPFLLPLGSRAARHEVRGGSR